MKTFLVMPASLLAFSLISASLLPIAGTSSTAVVNSVTVAAAQTTDPPRCATAPVSATKARQVEQAMISSDETALPTRAPGTVNVPVVFHVIISSTGEGDIPENQLDAQIDVLNNSFSGATGGSNTPYRFFKRQVTTRTVNDRWFSATIGSPEEREMKTALNANDRDYDRKSILNFYTNKLNHYALKVHRLPMD